MAKKDVKKFLKHYNEYSVSPSGYPESIKPKPDPDKSKSISELNREELWDMLARLRDETEAQRIIRELKRNSGEKDSYDKPFKIDTKTPINQLYHFGIKGQKWGVRRFQNEDGTRTSAGKKRDSRHGKSEDYMKSRAAKKRGKEGLSNDELKKLNERLRLEEDYKKLTAEKMEKSESWVKQAIKTGGQQALTDFSKGVFLGAAKALVNELSPQFAEVAGFTPKKKSN